MKKWSLSFVWNLCPLSASCILLSSGCMFQKWSVGPTLTNELSPSSPRPQEWVSFWSLWWPSSSSKTAVEKDTIGSELDEKQDEDRLNRIECFILVVTVTKCNQNCSPLTQKLLVMSDIITITALHLFGYSSFDFVLYNYFLTSILL